MFCVLSSLICMQNYIHQQSELYETAPDKGMHNFMYSTRMYMTVHRLSQPCRVVGHIYTRSTLTKRNLGEVLVARQCLVLMLPLASILTFFLWVYGKRSEDYQLLTLLIHSFYKNFSITCILLFEDVLTETGTVQSYSRTPNCATTCCGMFILHNAIWSGYVYTLHTLAMHKLSARL